MVHKDLGSKVITLVLFHDVTFIVAIFLIVDRI